MDLTATDRPQPGPEPTTAAGLEAAGREAYLRLDFDETVRCWELAHARFRAEGDGTGAVRVARNVASIHGTVRGDWAVASGWLARARSLGAAGSPEAGWVALTTGMFEGDRSRKESAFRVALDVGRATDDIPLTLVTSAYLGASLVHRGHALEGMPMLDEALAGVAAGEVSDPVQVEEVFCQLFSACEVARDVDRADQWIRMGLVLADRTGQPVASAYCHTHYGGVMTAAGRWEEAEQSLREGIRLWVVSQRTLRAGAVARLAELRVHQGRLEEAEALLSGLPEDFETSRPRALLCQSRGDLERAREVLKRALASPDSGLAAAPLLAQLVDVEIAAGRLEEATAAARQLQALAADPGDSSYLRGQAAAARGRVARATGAEAGSLLREAVDLFTRAQMPYEAATARLDLAAACAERRPDLAADEARTAWHELRRLPAGHLADVAAALLRSLGQSAPPARAGGGVLTAREEQVLALLGEGLTNREIAERLVVSPKTVEHHVSRLLAKLGLRNRSEAAAHAVRRTGAGSGA